MDWIKRKMQNEDGLLFFVLAVVGAVAIVIWVAHRI